MVLAGLPCKFFFMADHPVVYAYYRDKAGQVRGVFIHVVMPNRDALSPTRACEDACVHALSPTNSCK